MVLCRSFRISPQTSHASFSNIGVCRDFLRTTQETFWKRTKRLGGTTRRSTKLHEQRQVMSKLATSADRSGIFISDAYENWHPSQTWLAEMTRTVATRMFAQANLE